MPALKLTKSALNKLTPGSKDAVYFDTELPGFGLRIKPSGARAWLIQYRNRHGRSRRLTLAMGAKLAPEEARKQAKKLFAAIADGGDPAEQKHAARKAITVGELADLYLASAATRLKPATLVLDRSRIKRHVKPLLGSRVVASLTPADMEKFLRDVISGKTAVTPPRGKGGVGRARGGVISGGKTTAARTLTMLGTILEIAVRDGLIQRNPARGVKRPKDNARKPPFAFETIGALGTAMRAAKDDGENIVGLRVVRFLLLSGCRRSEALTLRWGMVDRRDQCLRLPDTKTGPQVRPLGRAALAWLLSFEPKNAKATDFVFPGPGRNGHLVGLPRVWRRVCKRAAVVDVPIHGMRHWFASGAAAMGFSELTIAGLIGHKVRSVTGRYATAPDRALIAAADSVSGELADWLDGAKRGGPEV